MLNCIHVQECLPSSQEHQRYCQSVRYSPDGNFWVSGGFDGKIFLYEGKESALIGEIQEVGGKNAHGGGIYAVSWAGNSRSILTASGDKTCKIWDVEAKKATTTFTIGTTVEDQQLGCLWSGDYMISVSLSGYINYLDPRTPSRPVRIIGGSFFRISRSEALSLIFCELKKKKIRETKKYFLFLLFFLGNRNGKKSATVYAKKILNFLTKILI